MANQHTVKIYNDDEIKEIISLYKSGMPYTLISRKLQRKKTNIKKILIEKSVWIENRDVVKKEFSENEVQRIIDLYVNKHSSTRKIAEIFDVSSTPIKRILNERNLLRVGKSNGIKIILSNEEKEEIENLYINEHKSGKEIGEILNINPSFLDKYLGTTSYRRNKSAGASIGLVKRFSGVDYISYLKNLSEQEKYKRKVINLTKKQPLHLLENHAKRGCSGIKGAYHLDHKFSILEGFKNNIKPEIIASLNNLVFIPWEENIKKRTSCSITKEELINN